MKYEWLINNLEYLLANRGIEDYNVRANGMFYYVPLPLDRFETQLNIALTACSLQGIENPKFVDVGCGVGTKVVMAAQVGCEAYGIEYDAAYCKIASRLLARIARYTPYRIKQQKHIVNKDALLVDYKPYDIIYFYRPFANPKKESELERHIINTAKSGAIILANNKQDYSLWDRPSVQPLEHGRDRYSTTIFRKL